MLKRVQRRVNRGGGGRFVIVAAKYNARYVEGMLGPARKVLADAGAERVEVIRVPGAFEIPVAAAKAASEPAGRCSAVICLGVILRGETAHAQQIGEAVSQALAMIQVRHLVPVIHEVLLLENAQQAEVRCLGREHNRGAEAAYTALEMARVMKQMERLAGRGKSGS